MVVDLKSSNFETELASLAPAVAENVFIRDHHGQTQRKCTLDPHLLRSRTRSASLDMHSVLKDFLGFLFFVLAIPGRCTFGSWAMAAKPTPLRRALCTKVDYQTRLATSAVLKGPDTGPSRYLRRLALGWPVAGSKTKGKTQRETAKNSKCVS